MISRPARKKELAIVIPHLGDGGVQRVVSILANIWSGQGRRLCVISLYKDDEAYTLDKSIEHIRLYDWQYGGFLLMIIESLRLKVERLKNLKLFLVLMDYLEKAGFFTAISSLNKTLLKFIIRLSSLGLISGLWKIHLPIFFRVQKLRQAIDYTGAPVVLSFCGSANIMSILAGKPLGKKVIISERNDPCRQKLEFPWNAMRSIFYGQADVVTANSRGALPYLEKYVLPEKLLFVPNPLPQPPQYPVDGPGSVKGNPHRILIVARLHRQKGHKILLDAFAQCSPSLKNWCLSIVGRGDLKEDLQQQAKELGIDQLVDWHGQVNNPFDYYRSADLFVLPSLHEGMPNALLEAMSCGLAVVISDASPGPLELIEHGQTGWVVPVNDATALARAMVRLAQDPALRSSLGEAARASILCGKPSITLTIWEKLLGWQTEGKIDDY
ncbi:glycosyltransferase [candidate division CSSED10-310 bacterium]|uniref:Glycosyltransferase n=1 Tax=candidate division CSSED10-310 bacterium TaxID=2855610 RepID=A0ABV6Z364_UNCC1